MSLVYVVTSTDYHSNTTRLFLVGNKEEVDTHLASYGRTMSYYNPYAAGRTSIAKPCNMFLVDRDQFRELLGGNFWGYIEFHPVEGRNMVYVDLKESFPEYFV